jgi:hypothetical protein
MDEKKMKGLIKAPKVTQEDYVEGFCSAGYASAGTSVACQSGYLCGSTGVTSIIEDDELLT